MKIANKIYYSIFINLSQMLQMLRNCKIFHINETYFPEYSYLKNIQNHDLLCNILIFNKLKIIIFLV
jgi:hypothetical protein